MMRMSINGNAVLSEINRQNFQNNVRVIIFNALVH